MVMERIAEARSMSQTTPPPAPTCPICQKSWTCSGAHRVCCIPCGHMYGRSCLEWCLLGHDNESAECILCHQLYERRLIINLRAPGNLWDGCCRMQEEFRAKLEEERVGKAVSEGDAKTTWLMSLLIDKEKRWSEQFAQMERKFKEQMSTANAKQTLMKEQMNNIAEEKKKVCEELMKIKEWVCAFPLAIDPTPTDAMKKRRTDMTAPSQAQGTIRGGDGAGPSHSNAQPMLPPLRMLRPSPVASSMMKNSRDPKASQNHRRL